jgi:hypothetical protein
MMRPNRRKGLVFLLCSWLLSFNLVQLRASMPPEGAGGLVITILEGEGALNDIRERTAREPIVQIEDENHRPVAGASVVFLLPNSGASGSFADGVLRLSTISDINGRAIGRGFHPNNVPGNFQIQVIATAAGRTVQTTINQQNSSSTSNQTEHNSTAPRPVHAVPLKIILIAVGAAAAGGTVAAILAMKSGTSTVVTAGTPTVGAPSIVQTTIRIPLHFKIH